MAIDAATLKVGDRIKVQIDGRDPVICNATVLDGNLLDYRLVYLDEQLPKGHGYRSFRIAALSSPQQHALASTAIQNLRLDPDQPKVWSVRENTTVLETIEPVKKSVDINALKAGTRVKMTIDKERQVEGTVLDAHYEKSPSRPRLVLLDKPYSGRGTSFSYSALTNSSAARTAIEALGLNANDHTLWYDSGDTTYDEVIEMKKPVDTKTLKIGDRVKITITLGAQTETRTGVVVDVEPTEGTRDTPRIYLDEPYKSPLGGQTSYDLSGLSCPGLRQLGLDETKPNIWHGIRGDTVIDEILPKIDPSTLKCGDRIKFRKDGEIRDGVMLNPVWCASECWIAEVNGKSKEYGWNGELLPEWAKDAEVDTTKFGYSSYPHSKIEVLSVEPKTPVETSIDQDDLEVGDEIEIEIQRDGETIKRTATVVAAAKSERAHYKNDSEAGVILHEAAPHEESPSFQCLPHWREQTKALNLPRGISNGWRLYKSGRNTTKVLRKIRKRVMDEKEPDTYTEGMRVECWVSGKRYHGVVVGEESNARGILLDEQPRPPKVWGTPPRFLLASQSKLGLKADHTRLISWGEAYCIRYLGETLAPSSASAPLTIDEAIHLLSKEVSDTNQETVMLNASVVRQVLKYALKERLSASDLEKKVDEVIAANKTSRSSSEPEAIKEEAVEEEPIKAPSNGMATPAMMAIGAGLGALLSAILRYGEDAEGVRVAPSYGSPEPAEGIIDAPELTATT